MPNVSKSFFSLLDRLPVVRRRFLINLMIRYPELWHRVEVLTKEKMSAIQENDIQAMKAILAREANELSLIEEDA